jgi:hypothetical protein
MRDLFSHQDFTRVGHYQSVLEAEGIPTFIRNQNTNFSMADMPAAIFFPTLCVVNDEDYDAAMELLRPLYQPAPVSGPEWLCPSCSQSNPANFEICWNCKTEKAV